MLLKKKRPELAYNLSPAGLRGTFLLTFYIYGELGEGLAKNHRP
jgi:hypothetical protein